MSKTIDPWDEVCRKSNEDKKSIYIEAIEKAEEENGHHDVVAEFCQSCRKFLNDSNFLTEKQVQALEKFHEPIRVRRHSRRSILRAVGMDNILDDIFYKHHGHMIGFDDHDNDLYSDDQGYF